ncbi:hypothetical protein Tsp_09810 [Trichinella spiralis]|uniref:hypothetical protein n=1 Tax=Trichinella spiralis TaxID=6334 RepID=UPI0001EFD7ED|nr:hypothetical protein Tsp_09810 [Trichinella spiralis]
METMHVDQEIQNGDQGRHEAQNCPKTDPKHHDTDKCNAKRCPHGRLSWPPARTVPCTGTNKRTSSASAGWTNGRRAETRAGVVVAAALLLFSLVRIHAQLIRLTEDRQLVAVQIQGPFETVLAHQGRAAGTGPFAYRPAGR